MREAVISMLGKQRVVVGTELDRLDDATLAAGVERIPVYARVTAAHKLKIVSAWKSRGQVVAMTGDAASTTPPPSRPPTRASPWASPAPT